MDKEMVSIWVEALCTKHHMPRLDFMMPKDIYTEIQDVKGTIANEKIYLKGGSEFAEENIANLENYLSVLEEALPEGYTLEREKTPFKRLAPKIAIAFIFLAMTVVTFWCYFIKNIIGLNIQYTWCFFVYLVLGIAVLGSGFLTFIMIANVVDTAKEIKEDKAKKGKRHGK